MPMFMEMLGEMNSQGKRLCVGLDPDPGQIPPGVSVQDFLFQVVDSTAPFVAAFKPNIAFYEGLVGGWDLYGALVARIHQMYPGIPVIADMKRGDIGKTNKGYIGAAFDTFRVDAITVHPYLGRESLQVFLDRAEKGIIVLCRTSNPGAGEFQDLICKVRGDPVLGQEEFPLYQVVARNVERDWNTNGNCGLVVGATFPSELAEVQKIAPGVFKLIPGVGTQGGDLPASVTAAYNPKALPDLVINVSSAVLNAYKIGPFQCEPSEFARAAGTAAQSYHQDILAITSGLDEAA